MFVVIGLGNPGEKYAQTRHNVGHMVIDELINRLGTKLSLHKQSNTRAACARLMVIDDAESASQRKATGQGAAHANSPRASKTSGGTSASAKANATVSTPAGAVRTSEQVIFAISNSFMNTTGGPASSLLRYFNGDVDHLIVIHDDLDLEFGALRLKRGGGEGGHNGLKSISQSLGSKNYIRMRVGIGRPPERQDPADYVLGTFNAAQRKELPFMISDAADAVIDVLEQGIERATMRLHTAQKVAGK